MNQSADWLMLVISLPTRNATERMRIWRALKSLGCAVLRDGVYVLPRGDRRERALAQLGEGVIEAGGSAHLIRVESRDKAQRAAFRALFDRSADYADLAKQIARVNAVLSNTDPAAIRREMKALRRDFNAIAGVDFFPAESKNQAGSALAETEAAAIEIISPGEPHSSSGRIRRLEIAAYRGRVWATRKHPWVDRLASAWIIRRCIDPKARFIWLAKPADCPRKAVGFDFDGAQFTHIGGKVTFEVLLTSFGLDSDPALARLGAVVHYLDVGGIPAAEAAGLEAILAGARRRCRNDDALLAQATQIFNSIYAAYSEGEHA